MLLMGSEPGNPGSEGVRGFLKSLKVLFLSFKRIVGGRARLGVE